MCDKLFDNQIDITDFQFDKEVVKVFDDIVRRSVPGNDSMIQMIGQITRKTDIVNLNCKQTPSNRKRINY